MTPAAVTELSLRLARLPGLGRRSAARAALSLVKEKGRLLEPLIAALEAARDTTAVCSRCGSFTDRGVDPCALCADPLRDNSVLCVVEEPSDVLALEASGAFRGRYHVLGGKLSPSRRLGPDELGFPLLAERVRREGFAEVILALSTDMDGDATAGFLTELLSSSSTKVTRLAFGLPADSGVAYSDPLTLKRALIGRI